MKKVVSLSAAGSLAQQAYALVGPTPMMTLQAGEGADDVYCCLRMRIASSGTWIGLVADHSVFSDRIRMGLAPRFTVYPQSDVATVCGDASVRLLGRVDAPSELDESIRDVATQLAAEQPFELRDAVVLEVRPGNVRVVEEQERAIGSVPRT